MEWFFDFILEWILGAIIVVILFAWIVHSENELEKIRKGEQAQKTVIEQSERIEELNKENIELKEKNKELIEGIGAYIIFKVMYEEVWEPQETKLREQVAFYEQLHPDLKEYEYKFTPQKIDDKCLQKKIKKALSNLRK